LKFINKYYPGLPIASKPLQIAILFILATGLSILTYTLIEKPALNLKRRTPG